jgi:uncharacterized protein (UPF0333 family)
MNYGKLLSILIIVISCAIAIGYLIAGDYRRAIYWACAAGLNASVTF